MDDPIAIAIDTSCRRGGIAVGRGRDVLAAETFDAFGRHATLLVSRLKALVDAHDVAAAAIGHVYVSVGPGSFTGLRVGVTVARTLAQANPDTRCVAVPTALAIAENVRDLPWEHLAVVADARQGLVHVTPVDRAADGVPALAGPPVLAAPEEYLANAPTPLTLVGEGLEHHDLTARGDTLAPADAHLPAPRAVYAVGRRLADAQQFTPLQNLLPLYSRKPACES